MKKISLLLAAIGFSLPSPTFANSESIALTDGQIASIKVDDKHVFVEMGGYGYSHRTASDMKCPVNVIQTKFYFDVDSDSARIMSNMVMFALDKNSRVVVVSDPRSAKVECANEAQRITDIKLSSPVMNSHQR